MRWLIEIRSASGHVRPARSWTMMAAVNKLYLLNYIEPILGPSESPASSPAPSRRGQTETAPTALVQRCPCAVILHEIMLPFVRWLLIQLYCWVLLQRKPYERISFMSFSVFLWWSFYYFILHYRSTETAVRGKEEVGIAFEENFDSFDESLSRPLCCCLTKGARYKNRFMCTSLATMWFLVVGHIFTRSLQLIP